MKGDDRAGGFWFWFWFLVFLGLGASGVWAGGACGRGCVAGGIVPVLFGVKNDFSW